MKDVKDMTDEEILAFLNSISKNESEPSGGKSITANRKPQAFKSSTKLTYEDERHIIWSIARDINQYTGTYSIEQDRECPVIVADFEGYTYGDKDIEANISNNFATAYPDAIAACIEMCRIKAGVQKVKPTTRGAFFLSLALEWAATPRILGALPFYCNLTKSPSSRPEGFYNADFWLSSKVQARTILILIRWAGQGFPFWMREQRKEMVEISELSNKRWRT